MNNDSLIMQYDAQINRIEKEYREAQSRAKSLRKTSKQSPKKPAILNMLSNNWEDLMKSSR